MKGLGSEGGIMDFGNWDVLRLHWTDTEAASFLVGLGLLGRKPNLACLEWRPCNQP